MKTKAAVLHEVGRSRPYAESRPLVVETLEVDPPGEGEVLVRIGAAGLCHSDLSVMNGDRPRPVPMALGHEAAGEVVEIGRGVDDLLPGDHVVMIFVRSEEHTSELQSLMRISYAVFCLKNKKHKHKTTE